MKVGLSAERRTGSARLWIPAQQQLHRSCERHGMEQEAPGNAAMDLAANLRVLYYIIKHVHV